MSWTTPVDIYCERTSALFWAEPINAWTNAAFWLAALVAFLAWRRAGSRDWPVLALIVLTAAVGIGSFLFHTFAQRWAGLADVVPIAFFILGYLVLGLRRYLGLGIVGALAGLGVYLAAGWALPQLVTLPPGPWRGLFGYVPALVALVVVAVIALVRAGRVEAFRAHPKNRAYGAAAQGPTADPARTRAAAWAMLAAAGVFTVSLVFRTLDMPLCRVVPIGTHFLWHLLNAVVLFMLLRAAIRHRPAG